MEAKTETINIIIDDKHYQVHAETMTGAQLKALAGIPPNNLLFLEEHGPGDDELITNETTVHLHDGDHFYDMPPGNFGLE
ncbi:MAG: multiubiquitin domain-containing protein [Acidimicrobiales bacterium]